MCSLRIKYLTRCIAVTLALTSCYLGCNLPSKVNDEVVRREFLAEDPSASIISITPGEGDSDTVYIYVKYQRPPDTTAYTEERQYMKDTGGTWVFRRKREVVTRENN